MSARLRLFVATQVAILAAAVAVAIATARLSDWEPLSLVGLLLVLAVATDLVTIPTKHLRISGSHVVFVLAMALCGPAPAMTIAVVAVLCAAVRERPSTPLLANNLATYATFPLLGGLAIRYVSESADLHPQQTAFLLLVFVVFLLSNLLNFVMSVGALCVLEHRSLWVSFKTMFIPILPSELATGLLATGIVWIYGSVGLAALALLAGVLFTFQYLLR